MSVYTWRGKPAVNPCGCGCGEEAPIARRTDMRPDHLQVKGQPLRYINGHNHGARSNVKSAAEKGHTGPRSGPPAPAVPPLIHLSSPLLPGFGRTGCGITQPGTLTVPATADPALVTCRKRGCVP